jgi:AAT family amino acid transporter
VSFALNVVFGYALALVCVNTAQAWLPAQTVAELTEKKDLVRFLWYHSAEIAGFTLMPFLIWHHYFDDMAPFADKDSWGAFGFRTIGVFALCAVNYYVFYYVNWGYWGLGNEHMAELAHRFPMGESLIWNFWWIIPLLWNEWFFHKWPFYVHEHH